MFYCYLLIIKQELYNGSSLKRDFTLDQFFDIWNQEFELDQIFNNTVTDNAALTVYFSWDMLKNGTNYRDIVLHSHDEIANIYSEYPIISLKNMFP